MAILLGLISKFLWNIVFPKTCGRIFLLKENRFHGQQIHKSRKIGLCANRNLHRHRMGQKLITNALHCHRKIRTDFIHFIDKTKTRKMVFLALPPDGFALCLNPLGRIKNRHRAIENPQRTLHFRRKINMPGGVDEIDVVPLPRTFCHGRSNRDAPLLLFLHKVHNRSSIMNFADFMGLSAEVQNAFCHRCLAGVNVGHDTDISDIGQIRCHEIFLRSSTTYSLRT